MRRRDGMGRRNKKETTKTHRTHGGWIDMVERAGFTFRESLHINDVGDHDYYIFAKE